MRWLLLKDLQILRRSPLLVALLVVYPIAIARADRARAVRAAPSKPKVAFVNQVPPGESTLHVGGERRRRRRLRRPAVRVGRPDRGSTPAQEAIDKVTLGRGARRARDPAGRPSLRRRSAWAASSRRGRGPLQRRGPGQAAASSSRTIDSRAGRGERRALGRGSSEVAVQATSTLLLDGGELSLPSSGARRHPRAAQLRRRSSQARCGALPPRRAAARRARAGRALRPAWRSTTSTSPSDVLGTVGQPVEVEQTIVSGKRTPLDTFAVAVSVTVSLMFVTRAARRRAARAGARGARLRAARARAGLALGAAGRRRSGSRRCARSLVALVMLCGSAAFVIGSTGAASPLWLRGAGVAARSPSRALGVAIGALAREVRAASLLAFLLSLPIAFLALVPSGRGRRAASTTSSASSRRCSRSSRRSQALDAAINGAGRRSACRCCTWRVLSRSPFGRALRRALGAAAVAYATPTGPPYPQRHGLPRDPPAPPARDRRPARARARDRAARRRTSICPCSSSQARRAGARRSQRCPASTASRSTTPSRRPARPPRSASPPCCCSASPPTRTSEGSGAWDDEGVVQLATRAIKEAHPELLVITDVCLCEYTEPRPLRRAARRTAHVDNDATLELLARTAVSQAARRRRRRRARAT